MYPITDVEVPPLDAAGKFTGRVVYYPIRLGYASTIHQYQGAELEHMTLWPDLEGIPAGAYVALSRIRHETDYLIGGIVTCNHFVPAK